jgi:hypothetical protein
MSTVQWLAQDASDQSKTRDISRKTGGGKAQTPLQDLLKDKIKETQQSYLI